MYLGEKKERVDNMNKEQETTKMTNLKRRYSRNNNNIIKIKNSMDRLNSKLDPTKESFIKQS